MRKSGYFEEDNGSKSSIRLMSYQSWWAAFVIGLLMAITDNVSDNGLLIFFGFLIGAFAPKLVQKFAEQKIK